MARIPRTAPSRNQDEDLEGAWRDRAVIKLADRFALPINVAQVIADHAGLGQREAA